MHIRLPKFPNYWGATVLDIIKTEIVFFFFEMLLLYIRKIHTCHLCLDIYTRALGMDIRDQIRK